MQKVVLATGNAGKVRELASLLSDFGLDIVAQTELGVESAEETGLTFIENRTINVRLSSTVCWSICVTPLTRRRWCATVAGLV